MNLNIGEQHHDAANKLIRSWDGASGSPIPSSVLEPRFDLASPRALWCLEELDSTEEPPDRAHELHRRDDDASCFPKQCKQTPLDTRKLSPRLWLCGAMGGWSANHKAWMIEILSRANSEFDVTWNKTQPLWQTNLCKPSTNLILPSKMPTKLRCCPAYPAASNPVNFMIE